MYCLPSLKSPAVKKPVDFGLTLISLTYSHSMAINIHHGTGALQSTLVHTVAFQLLADCLVIVLCLLQIVGVVEL